MNTMTATQQFEPIIIYADPVELLALRLEESDIIQGRKRYVVDYKTAAETILRVAKDFAALGEKSEQEWVEELS